MLSVQRVRCSAIVIYLFLRLEVNKDGRTKSKGRLPRRRERKMSCQQLFERVRFGSVRWFRWLIGAREGGV